MEFKGLGLTFDPHPLPSHCLRPSLPFERMGTWPPPMTQVPRRWEVKAIACNSFQCFFMQIKYGHTFLLSHFVYKGFLPCSSPRFVSLFFPHPYHTLSLSLSTFQTVKNTLLPKSIFTIYIIMISVNIIHC